MLHNSSDIRQWQILSSGQTLLSDRSFPNTLQEGSICALQVYCGLRSCWPRWCTDHLQSAQILCPYFKGCCWNSCILSTGFVIWIVLSHLFCYWLVKIGWRCCVSHGKRTDLHILTPLAAGHDITRHKRRSERRLLQKTKPKMICDKRAPQREALESRSFTHRGRSRGENAQLSPVYVPGAKRSQMLNQLVV